MRASCAWRVSGYNLPSGRDCTYLSYCEDVPMSLSRIGVMLAALLLGIGEARAAWVETAFWPFNELTGTVADDAVGLHDGTISGGVALGSSGQNGRGTSFQFVGNGRVVIPNMGTLSPGPNWMEASIRIKTTNVPVTGDFNLFRSGEFPRSLGFKIELLTGGRASCSFKGTAGHYNNVASTSSVANNKWNSYPMRLAARPAGRG